MHADDREVEFYRRVEDLFSSLRGVPHVLSPRDFQLLRSWWRDGVPLAAVSAGLTEVFARQHERADADPVSSLSYCRHAVKRHAKRLAEMRVGDGGHPATEVSPGELAEGTITRLQSSAEVHRATRPAVAEVLDRTAAQVRLAIGSLPPEALDEHLFALESAMLRDCGDALGEKERRDLEARVEAAVDGSTVSEEARARASRALRDREIRLLLDLPRLDARD